MDLVAKYTTKYETVCCFVKNFHLAMVHGTFIFQNPIKEKKFNVDKNQIFLALKMHKNTLITTVKTGIHSDLRFLSYGQKGAKFCHFIIFRIFLAVFWL